LEAVEREPVLLEHGSTLPRSLSRARPGSPHVEECDTRLAEQVVIEETSCAQLTLEVGDV